MKPVIEEELLRTAFPLAFAVDGVPTGDALKNLDTPGVQTLGYRVVRERFEFEGFVFPAGWTIRLCVAESHRLPEQFEDADVFNPDRFLSRDFSSDRYSPFGHGPHACNGVALTQAICGAVLEELTARFDWSVSGDGHYERDFRHWAHLRPSSNLMLSLGPFALDRASSSVREARG